MEWLELNFASCVIRQARSFGVLILCFIYNMVVCELNLRYGC